MEDNLKKNKMKDDLKKTKQKTTALPKKWKRRKKERKKSSQFLLNLGANLSWGWLSSLRFLVHLSLN
jgi:hypothetical protein